MDFKNVNDVVIKASNCVVDISRGDDELCRFVSTKDKYFTLSESGGTLTVKQKPTYIFYRAVVKRVEIKLVLPKSFGGKLKLRNNNGELYVKDVAFKELDLSTKNGKFELCGINCGEFSLKMKNGAVGIKNLTAQDPVSLKCSNGRIKTECAAAPSITMSSSNAALTALDVKANRLDCRTSNGVIDASGIDCGEVKLETSNGKISALVLGGRDEHRLLAETKHGTVSVNGVPCKNVADRDGAKKRVTVSTSNGDIDIKFM